MKRSKKGITLVELIICCAIIVMIGGACSAVIASGSTVFNQSTKTAGAQLDSDVLQTFMMNILPSVKNVGIYSAAGEMGGTEEYLFIDQESDAFTIRTDGANTTIRSVTGFEYIVIQAGSADDAKAQFLYKAMLDDGSSLSGGFVLSNVKYSSVPAEIKPAPETEPVYINLADKPIVFNFTSEGG